MAEKSVKIILLVEDNPGDARLLREMIHESGSHTAELTMVESMSAAEEFLAVSTVDIILLDLGLPDAQVLTISTMCGHGMISHSLAKKMVDFVREGRRTPEQAVTYLARFCSCGVFNPARACRLLKDVQRSR